MSERYRDWNSALSHISNYLKQIGIELKDNSFSIEIKHVDKFCKHKNVKLNGLSDMYLYVVDNWKEFREFTKAELKSALTKSKL